MSDTATTMGELAEKLRPILSELNRTSCSDHAAGRGRCFDRPPSHGSSWVDIDPETLCLGCRAYWYVSRAEDALHRMDRLRLEDGTKRPR